MNTRSQFQIPRKRRERGVSEAFSVPPGRPTEKESSFFPLLELASPSAACCFLGLAAAAAAAGGAGAGGAGAGGGGGVVELSIMNFFPHA